MGLGKTVQVIGLLSVLLKQGPYGGKPIIRRCLIVTPGSLVMVITSKSVILLPFLELAEGIQ